MNCPAESQLVREYKQSRFAATWRRIWKLLPAFSAKHSPFFIFDDGVVLWNQGFGRIAFLQGGRSLTVNWSLERNTIKVIHLSSVHRWDAPHDYDPVSDTQLEDLKKRFTERFRARGEEAVFR